MKLLLKRIALRPTYTIGRLFIDGERFCDTCEDKVRDTNKDGDLLDEGEGKVYAETAIPYGTYDVTLNVQSPKFRTKKAYEFCKGFLPRLLNVPHFEGILIHIEAEQYANQYISEYFGKFFHHTLYDFDFNFLASVGCGFEPSI